MPVLPTTYASTGTRAKLDELLPPVPPGECRHCSPSSINQGIKGKFYKIK